MKEEVVLQKPKILTMKLNLKRGWGPTKSPLLEGYKYFLEQHNQ